MAVTARPHARAAHSLVLPRRRARCTGGARSAARLEGPAWWAQARARGGAVGAAAAALGSGPTDAEREDWARRAAEAGGNNDSGEWSWTLNWDRITENILVGSCPRSVEDVDTLVDEAGVTAIMCLQSDACFEALRIDWEALRAHAFQRGVVMVRVPQRDFDKGDQALMLPETVRVLSNLADQDHVTYVHCTAGINRATLATLGYLTFVVGWTMSDALALIKAKRPQAMPYVESWNIVKGLMTTGRDEELKVRSRKIYHRRKEEGMHGGSDDDWGAAEREMISEQFARRLEIDRCMLRATRGSPGHETAHRLVDAEKSLERVRKEAQAIIDAAEALKTESGDQGEAIIDAAEALKTESGDQGEAIIDAAEALKTESGDQGDLGDFVASPWRL